MTQKGAVELPYKRNKMIPTITSFQYQNDVVVLNELQYSKPADQNWWKAHDDLLWTLRLVVGTYLKAWVQRPEINMWIAKQWLPLDTVYIKKCFIIMNVHDVHCNSLLSLCSSWNPWKGNARDERRVREWRLGWSTVISSLSFTLVYKHYSEYYFSMILCCSCPWQPLEPTAKTNHITCVTYG